MAADLEPESLDQKRAPSERADIVLGLAIAAGSVGLFALTLPWSSSAAVFPRIVATILFCLGLICAWQGLQAAKKAERTPFLPDPMGFLKVWIAIPLYFFGVWFIGFPIATILLTVGLSYQFGYRRWQRSLLAGVLFVVIMLTVFTGLFDRPLPSGMLFVHFFG